MFSIHWPAGEKTRPSQVQTRAHEPRRRHDGGKGRHDRAVTYFLRVFSQCVVVDMVTFILAHFMCLSVPRHPKKILGGVMFGKSAKFCQRSEL